MGLMKKFLPLALAVFCYGVLFTVLCILRYRAFFAETWEDSSVYNQILWNIVHGNGPYSSISGGMFKEHTSFILYPVALLYAIRPHIYNLFFILSFALGSGAIPVYLLSRKVLGSERLALYMAAVYLMLPLLHFLNFVDFRPLLLCVPLFLWAFYYFYTDRFKPFIVFILLALSCYETLSVTVVFFGIYAFFTRRKLKWILTPILLGAAWFMLSYAVILPAMGYKDRLFLDYFHRYFSTNGSAVLSGFSGVMDLPSWGEVMRRLWSRNPLMGQVFGWPFFFLPFLSPGALFIAVPTYLQIALQKIPMYIATGHQLAPFIPVMITAAIFGLRRCLFLFDRPGFSRARKPFLAAILVFLVAAGFGVNRYGSQVEASRIFDHRFENVRNIFDPVFYVTDDQDRIAWKLLAMIPPDASVCASGDLLPQLSHRKTIYEVKSDDEGRFVRDQIARRDGFVCLSVDCILLRTRSIENGSSTTDFDNAQSVDMAGRFVREGAFARAAQEGDFILLRKKDLSEAAS
jgi:uncharacterized membrane protein